MFDAATSVCISLGSVVLDRPDQTGLYIAKDLAGGWSYLVTDPDGDTRCRGQGVCDGGLDEALRCAFLAAVGRVPESAQITILVDSREAHRAVVNLAMADWHVATAIAGRPAKVMTRPNDRASMLVRAAAERAASAALRDREHAEWHDAAEAAANARPALRQPAGDTPAAPEAEPVVHREPAAPLPRRAAPVAQVAASPTMTRRLVASIRGGLARAGMLGADAAPRNRALTDWLHDFDARVASVRSDLQDVGA
jgi:hypothetical protein